MKEVGQGLIDQQGVHLEGGLEDSSSVHSSCSSFLSIFQLFFFLFVLNFLFQKYLPWRMHGI